MPVTEDLILVHARWSAPAAVPDAAGSLPRLRILASSSFAPSSHLRAASSNTLFNPAFLTASAQARKPDSPSFVVSKSLFSVAATLVLFTGFLLPWRHRCLTIDRPRSAPGSKCNPHAFVPCHERMRTPHGLGFGDARAKA